ncbi:hypothetical protein F8M41_005845 [Gigaspora margarita]|uniref:Uncharacterized protein n=1 Tax=Gigaspora margarita TaxID=4874 RepID=A0A8H3X9E7_GIGMA|nr:hypothetical protein F8M41_005845 [Gigaspora margarita]
MISRLLLILLIIPSVFSINFKRAPFENCGSACTVSCGKNTAECMNKDCSRATFLGSVTFPSSCLDDVNKGCTVTCGTKCILVCTSCTITPTTTTGQGHPDCPAAFCS